MLQNNSKLKSQINKLWDTFWSGGISNPLTAIEQITYLLFIKQLDNIETTRERNAEFTGEKYNSRFSGEYNPYFDENKYQELLRNALTENSLTKLEEWAVEKRKPRSKNELRWGAFINTPRPAEELLEHLRYNVFPFIKNLNGSTSAFTRHMANAVFIIEKPSLLVEATKQIEEIYKEIENDATEKGQSFQDIQGDVYEMLLSEIATAGKNGQFRTPRHIIKLMAELVAPKLGQKVADPACGTGGFLLGAYQYILTQLAYQTDPDVLTPDEDGFLRASVSAMLNEKLKTIIESSLYGFDIDTTMVRLGLMNLMMHGIDEPHIDYKDTLSKSYNEDGIYDIVMANPPFTGNIDEGDKNPSLQVETNKTELLFISRIFNMLKKGGTAAIIIPQGVLFGSGKAYVAARKIIVEESELKAVIAMPSGVFKPYAGVATAILIFTKAGVTDRIWFYNMATDGYSLDDRRSKIDTSDLQDIINQYQHRKELKNDRKSNCFSVEKNEVVENGYDLSFNKYRKGDDIQTQFRTPSLILEDLETIEQFIQTELGALKNMIS